MGAELDRVPRSLWFTYLSLQESGHLSSICPSGLAPILPGKKLCVCGGVQEGMPGEGGGWKDKARLATVPASYIHSLPRQLLPDT